MFRNPQQESMLMELDDLMAAADRGELAALDELARRLTRDIPHGSTCPYRVGGECLCVRADIVHVLDRHDHLV